MILKVVHSIVDRQLFGAAAALSADGLDATSPVTEIIDKLFAYVEAQLKGHVIIIALLKEANVYLDQWLATNPAPPVVTP